MASLVSDNLANDNLKSCHNVEVEKDSKHVSWAQEQQKS